MTLLTWQEVNIRLTGTKHSVILREARQHGWFKGLIKNVPGRGRHGTWMAQEDALPLIREQALAYQRERTAKAERPGEYGPWVPAFYFRKWARGILADPSVTLTFLAQEMGLDPRRLYNWIDEEHGATHIPYLLLEDALWNFKCIHVERVCPASAILISRPTSNRETDSNE